MNQNEGIVFEVMQYNAAFFCCQDYVPKKHGDTHYKVHLAKSQSTAFLNPFYF